MNLYSIDIKICGTAYIKAASAEEALEIARGLKDTSPQILEAEGGVPISGDKFDDPNLPDISISPAMTIYGPWGTLTRPELQENL